MDRRDFFTRTAGAMVAAPLLALVPAFRERGLVPVPRRVAALAGFDPDGFTISWDLPEPPPDGSWQFAAMAGDGSVRVGDLAAPQHGGEQHIAGVGFQPREVLLVGPAALALRRLGGAA